MQPRRTDKLKIAPERHETIALTLCIQEASRGVAMPAPPSRRPSLAIHGRMNQCTSWPVLGPAVEKKPGKRKYDDTLRLAFNTHAEMTCG
jgi:hypothetical protein